MTRPVEQWPGLRGRAMAASPYDGNVATNKAEFGGGPPYSALSSGGGPAGRTTRQVPADSRDSFPTEPIACECVITVVASCEVLRRACKRDVIVFVPSTEDDGENRALYFGQMNRAGAAERHKPRS